MRPGPTGHAIPPVPNRVSSTRDGVSALSADPTGIHPMTSSIRSVEPLAFENETAPPDPSLASTRLATVRLATMMRLEALVCTSRFGQTVIHELAVGAVTVSFRRPRRGLRHAPSPTIIFVITSPGPSGVERPPVPSRVSMIRSGLTGTTARACVAAAPGNCTVSTASSSLLAASGPVTAVVTVGDWLGAAPVVKKRQRSRG